jgi:tetratricopeptide (TPR) repeat protein
MDTRVEVGNFTLQVGSPAGTLIEASGAAATGDDSLRRALEEPAAKKAETAPALATEVEEASEATAKIERAVALGKGIGEGRALDPTQLGLEVGALLDCLERLDRKGKHKKSLQMARALATLLMLLKRWADLLKTLRSALRAAELLDDQEAIAWAKHELGTLRLAAGDLEGADRDLGQAREIRERIGDRRGLAATERNMAVLCKCLRALLQAEELVRRAPRSRLTPRLALFALLFAFLFAAAGFAAGSMTSSSDSAEAENAGDLSQPPKNPGGNTADEYSSGIPTPTGTDTKSDNPEVIPDPTDATPAPVTEPEPSSTTEPIPTPERVPEPKPPLPEEEPVREPG